MDGRLPAHVEVAGLLRSAEAAGGFGTVIAKGERDAGIILILTMEKGRNACLWERMPQPDGHRRYAVARRQDPDNPLEFGDYIERRKRQDRDCWIVELDIADPERFVALQQN